MNRETKRAMARQQRTTDQGQRLQQLRKQQASRQQQAVGRVATGGRRRSIRTFGSEVMAELRKVNWPDRKTVLGYTVVVLVSVSVITAIIFGLDYLFGQAVVALYT